MKGKPFPGIWLRLLNWKERIFIELLRMKLLRMPFKTSIKQARGINEDLVNAQQARRMLDRMVGYRISPLLWEKVKRGLSAGRVQ